MISNATQRSILRWIHIIVTIPIFGYIYGPASEVQQYADGVRYIFVPVMVLSGLWMFSGVIFAILGVAAKLERRRILERTARGRADAKANGVKFGRKPILTPHQQKEARQRIAVGETQRSVARSYNVSQSTISRLTAI